MLAVIQARMSSQRLVGKVLLPLAGKPLLRWVYDRLSQADSISNIVVSTSKSASDVAIVDFCREHKIPVHRGSLDDVAGRLLDCARREGADSFVRISGDSPLIDPVLVDQAVALASAAPYDLTTNVQSRSFPKGQSVEAIRIQSLARARANMRDLEDREHVTRYFYTHPRDFAIRNFSCGEAMEGIQLSVDTLEDLRVAELLLERLGEHFSWRAAAALRAELQQ